MDDARRSAQGGMLDGLREAVRGLSEAQRGVLEVTGVAWSDDRLIKVTVGPRGQLTGLDLDPRLFRKPDSKALAAAILATARNAVEDAMHQTAEIVEGLIPADLLTLRPGELDLTELIRRHDADLGPAREEGS